MATEPDPPPLPRPHVGPADPPTERVRAARAYVADQIGALVTPAMAFVGVAVAGIVVWSRLGAAPPAPLEMTLPTVDPAAVAAPATPHATPESATFTVHVAGAVVRPGVYELTAEARVADAVALAGGSSVDADLDRINLAALVTDGAQINVPRLGQAAVVPLEPSTGATVNGAAESIDINTADAALLETLPGIGPSTAAAIIGHREEYGPFPSVAALDDVSGIGPARLDALRDLVRVGGAP